MIDEKKCLKNLLEDMDDIEEKLSVKSIILCKILYNVLPVSH